MPYFLAVGLWLCIGLVQALLLPNIIFLIDTSDDRLTRSFLRQYNQMSQRPRVGPVLSADCCSSVPEALAPRPRNSRLLYLAGTCSGSVISRQPHDAAPMDHVPSMREHFHSKKTAEMRKGIGLLVKP